MKSMTVYIASHFTHMKMHPESIRGYGIWIINPNKKKKKKKITLLYHHNVYA